MFTQLQFNQGRFIERTFEGLDCIKREAFTREVGRPSTYTDADLDRVQYPEPAMHCIPFYARKAQAAIKAGDKASEDTLTNAVLRYIDATMGQISRRVEQ